MVATPTLIQKVNSPLPKFLSSTEATFRLVRSSNRARFGPLPLWCFLRGQDLLANDAGHPGSPVASLQHSQRCLAESCR
jgi:hypothetical protein